MEVFPTLLIFLFFQISTTKSTNCIEEFNYHDDYGYGYDIICSHLNKTNIQEFENITVYNEIKLTIFKSNLTNLKLFKNIPKIKEVFVTDSQIDLSHLLLNETELKLNKLVLLSITNSLFKGLSKHTLSGLDNLQTLNFSNSNLQNVQFESGVNFSSSIKVIDLSFNSIHSLDEVPLCEFENLEKFVVRNNFLVFIDERLIKCLRSLQHLYLDYNKIRHLDPFGKAKFLLEISLSYNKIETLAGVFKNLKYLEVLNLEGNMLKSISFNDLSNLTNLQRLNLKNNKISVISTLENLNELQVLDLRNNTLSEIPNFALPNLKQLFLSYNSLKLKNENFLTLKNLQILEMRSCDIIYIDAFSEHLQSIEKLDLSSNKLKIKKKSFAGFSKLQDLNLQSNSLKEIPDYAFENNTNLKNLDISFNNLTKLSKFTFYNLRQLEVLNLSHNLLESIYPSSINGVKMLKILDLENNKLKYIAYDSIIDSLPYLNIINIHKNRLPCEFLSTFVGYFHKKNINFSTSQQLTLNKENVAGINCYEKRHVNEALSDIGKYKHKIDVPLAVGVTLTIGLILFSFAMCYNFFHVIKRKMDNLISSYDDVELLETSSRRFYS